MNNYIYTQNDYCREQFGHKLYKLAISGGMTCPNRDGTLGSRGCIFCSERGSGEFAEPATVSVSQQLARARERISGKYKGNSFIAYFQPFTNTYAKPDYLREIFSEAASFPGVEAVSVATRPDCLDSDVLGVLEELTHSVRVWVELGLQTVKRESIEYIRRGYATSVYDTALTNLKSLGIHTVTHMILGLPGENSRDMQNTAEHIVQCGSDGIKLQLLHVIRDTDLCRDYLDGRFQTLSLEEYTDRLIGCVERLSPKTVIHRFTGDGDKKSLVAPLWSEDKKRVLGYINSEFMRRGAFQGRLYSNSSFE